MKPFRYLCDPLFLACLALYFINRLILKPYLPNAFSRFYLNDVICIPFWVPIMLFTMRILHLRRDDLPPRAHEILIPLLLWSWLFEVVAPRSAAFRGLAFGDPTDVLCYSLGALISGLWWGYWHRGRGVDAIKESAS